MLDDEDRMKIGDIFPHLKKDIVLNTEFYSLKQINRMEL